LTFKELIPEEIGRGHIMYTKPSPATTVNAIELNSYSSSNLATRLAKPSKGRSDRNYMGPIRSTRLSLL